MNTFVTSFLCSPVGFEVLVCFTCQRPKPLQNQVVLEVILPQSVSIKGRSGAGGQSSCLSTLGM